MQADSVETKRSVSRGHDPPGPCGELLGLPPVHRENVSSFAVQFRYMKLINIFSLSSHISSVLDLE